MFNGTVRRYVSSLPCRGEEIDIGLMKLQPAAGQLSTWNSISINCSALTSRSCPRVKYLHAGSSQVNRLCWKQHFVVCIGGCRWWLPGLWGIYDVALPILPFGLWCIVSFAYHLGFCHHFITTMKAEAPWSPPLLALGSRVNRPSERALCSQVICSDLCGICSIHTANEWIRQENTLTVIRNSIPAVCDCVFEVCLRWADTHKVKPLPPQISTQLYCRRRRNPPPS